MDTELIEARQEVYREAHNSLEVERFMALFSEDAEYSDSGRWSSLPLTRGKQKAQCQVG